MIQFLISALAAVGALALIYLVVGVWLDVRGFDQTKGGYEAPYTGWSGQPVDWQSFDRTREGIVKRGHVVDVRVNMTTGMITFEVAGFQRDWRTFSGRALAVHKPREAALAMGFDPQF